MGEGGKKLDRGTRKESELKYSVEGHLLRVEFNDFPMPQSPVLGKLFPGRKAWINVSDQWVGVLCSVTEWQAYLDLMVHTFAAMDNGGPALAVMLRFQEQLNDFLSQNNTYDLHEATD